MRPDLLDVMAPDYQHRVGDLYELFHIIYNPALLFEFEAFKSVFARQLIPAQVVLNRRLILFNPARLTIFGNL